MSSFRERNDRNSGKSKSFSQGRRDGAKSAPKSGQETRYDPRDEARSEGRGEGRHESGRGDAYHKRRREDVADQWIWGWHACEAALLNPARPKPKRVCANEERAREIARLKGADGRSLADDLAVEILPNGEIARLLPPGAAHQGVAIRTPALESADLADFIDAPGGLLVMLDQVTDPQNVGAILRSAAAFGARGVILQDRHSPPLSGALAKAAAGALERVPCIQAVNLSRTLDTLAEAGWRAIGLAGEGASDLAEVLDETPTVLVMGSEGEGLRRLVAERCDVLARIPMPGGFESLNVASAAAIALYAAAVGRRS